MSAQIVEEILARLYTDIDFFESFTRSRKETLRGYDLDQAERASFDSLDISELMLATRSYGHKRSKRRPHRS